MSESPKLYPLLFEPIYKEKVWGGRTLEKLGRDLPGGADTRIGESWELVDLGATSESGGGGGSARSVVAEGPVAGKSLHELMGAYGRDLMGDLPRSDTTGGFPLLVKFLDANENLSVQVHPTAAYAADHPDAYLKNEAWYVIDREPGAVIYKGVREGVTPERFRRVLESGDAAAFEALLIKVPVEPGDCHYLPSGTCHALGAGVLVAEVQTPSDTTFRVFDWGRTGRALHIDQAMRCIHFGPPDVTPFEKNTHVAGDVADVTTLVTCEYFRMTRVWMQTGRELAVGDGEPSVWMVLDGEGRITCNGCDVAFEKGQTLLLPPGMGEARASVSDNTTWLEVTFPQARPTRMA